MPTERFCYRCNKPLIRPIPKNADYIMAADTVVEEVKEVQIALKPNDVTKAKSLAKEVIEDKDYDQVEVTNALEALGAVKINIETRVKNVQKTGLICPDCYKETDFVIWGVHKIQPQTEFAKEVMR